MTRVEKLESEVATLSPKELSRFRVWFAAFDAEEWDRQIETDVRSGRLDHLADQAIQDYKAGNCRKL